MTTIDLEQAGVSPESVSSWIAPFVPTAHRLSSVLATPTENGDSQITKEMDGSKWEGGYIYRTSACGVSQTWNPKCKLSSEQVAEQDIKGIGQGPWLWLDTNPIMQSYDVCADLKYARGNGLRQLMEAAVQGLNENLEDDLEELLWMESNGGVANLHPDRIIDPGTVYGAVEAFDRLMGFLQCSSRRLNIETTGTMASIWTGAGRIRPTGTGVAESVVGRHTITSGCYPTQIGPGGIELTEDQIAAGIQWIGVTDRPHGRVGGLFYDAADEPISFSMERDTNDLKVIAERTIATDTGICDSLAILAQAKSDEYCPTGTIELPETPPEEEDI